MIKKCIAVLVMALLFLASPLAVFAADVSVSATIPDFPVNLNGIEFKPNVPTNFNGLEFNPDEDAQYPLLVYKDITYFPMTTFHSTILNVNTNWTSSDGLVIDKGQWDVPKQFAYDKPRPSKNKKNQRAKIVTEKVTVNGKVFDTENEPYPLLFFRDITYFPLTWRFAVDEFGWDYTFDAKKGLNIRADNYFYTAKGDSGRAADGGYLTVPNETHYIHGDLEIHLVKQFSRLLGPMSRNLSIVKDTTEIKPEAYFAYYQKNGPLFTLDGNFIHTTYYTDPDKRDARLCKVNIKTGEIIRESDEISMPRV
ncbi:hypothetical protein O6R05_01485 [Peptoniphilus equinus]|uniref:Uncharacterized protein n=1 Tax=Peptoniphilus equinus TaxID=3016343 RepID=A0ABY7QTY8_9FIRM|nr:hypothetical protein [Peptoniphilus equinus]WBW50242.1 hypothetical protein O6R05_01485 [Peptoniphilus equinus]